MDVDITADMSKCLYGDRVGVNFELNNIKDLDVPIAAAQAILNMPCDLKMDIVGVIFPLPSWAFYASIYYRPDVPDPVITMMGYAITQEAELSNGSFTIGKLILHFAEGPTYEKPPIIVADALVADEQIREITLDHTTALLPITPHNVEDWTGEGDVNAFDIAKFRREARNQ